MDTGDIPPIEISTFGHFLVRRAGTGGRGGGKGAAQGAGGLPIAARLPRPSAPKCPKVATPIARRRNQRFPRLRSMPRSGPCARFERRRRGTGDRSDRNRCMTVPAARLCLLQCQRLQAAADILARRSACRQPRPPQRLPTAAPASAPAASPWLNAALSRHAITQLPDRRSA